MPVGQFSAVMPATTWENGGEFSANSIRLHELGERASPVAVLDDFRVRGGPFGPHPHAGFSALTYVFEDLQGRAQPRLLGNDVLVGPGGIVWFQAGRRRHAPRVSSGGGRRELHGAQMFVKLSARNKFIAPRTFSLDARDAPEWRNEVGDRVRVAVGSFQGVASPLVPAEPLDSLVHRSLRTVYVLKGGIGVCTDGREAQVRAEQALALYGSSGHVTFEASELPRVS